MLGDCKRNSFGVRSVRKHTNNVGRIHPSPSRPMKNPKTTFQAFLLLLILMDLLYWPVWLWLISSYIPVLPPFKNLPGPTGNQMTRKDRGGWTEGWKKGKKDSDHHLSFIVCQGKRLCVFVELFPSTHTHTHTVVRDSYACLLCCHVSCEEIQETCYVEDTHTHTHPHSWQQRRWWW